MNKKIEFTYLTEEEMIKSGVTEMDRCIDVMTEVFELLADGDYVMGGQNANSHGVEIDFPKHSPFPNMPLATPDRRFMAMIAYLGGRFDIAGVKWYGSNIENKKAGLPRSIHTIILSDKETGAPVAVMPGNLISSMRTGAVPGVGAKYLARKDSQILALIGAGVINRGCGNGILTAFPEIKKVKIYDVFDASAENLAEYLSYKHNVETETVDSIEEAVKDADIVNIATAGENAPKVEPSWLKQGVLLSLPAIVDLPKDFVINNRIITDNWKLYEAWIEEYNLDPRNYHTKLELVGGDIIDYVLSGEMNPDEFTDLGDIVKGEKEGRMDENETIIFAMGGMPVEDIAWALQTFENAKRKGLGETLTFWNEPHID